MMDASLRSKIMPLRAFTARMVLVLSLLLVSVFSFSPLAYNRARLGRSAQSKHDLVSSLSASATPTVSIWNEAELMDFASNQGVLLSLTTLGPGYRAVARAKHDDSLILGYVEGFLRPGGKILHLDKMQVFRSQVLRARRENPNEFSQGGSVFGVGLLMGYICLLYGKDNGYIEGEFLAIDDEEKQHRKLVQYYKRSGFEVIRYVGESVRDIPDRMLWGGVGTLMRQDIDVLLQRWTMLLSKTRPNKKAS